MYAALGGGGCTAIEADEFEEEAPADKEGGAPPVGKGCTAAELCIEDEGGCGFC